MNSNTINWLNNYVKPCAFTTGVILAPLTSMYFIKEARLLRQNNFKIALNGFNGLIIGFMGGNAIVTVPAIIGMAGLGLLFNKPTRK